MHEILTVRHPYLDRFVNTWVVNTESHTVLFDTGMFSGRARLERLITGKPVILSTHGDWDHIGGHAYFQKRGAPVWAHARDVRAMSDYGWQWQVYFEQFVHDCVIPPERRAIFADEAGEPFTPDHLLADRQELCFDGLKVRVIHTPGHTGGSLCFHLPGEGVLITGDTLMGGGFFGGLPQYSDPEEYLDSMEKLADLDVDRVYLSHHEEVLDRAGFRRRVREGADSARRMGETVRQYLDAGRVNEDTRLGDIAAHLAESEGKGMSYAVNITALSYLRGLRDEYPAAAVFDDSYVLNR